MLVQPKPHAVNNDPDHAKCCKMGELPQLAKSGAINGGFEHATLCKTGKTLKVAKFKTESEDPN